VVERLIGGGPVDGDALGGRAAAWPPDVMGAPTPTDAPEHPAVLAAQGRLHEVRAQPQAVADFGSGQWDDPTDDADELPVGSVAQEPFLPLPEPIAPAASRPAVASPPAASPTPASTAVAAEPPEAALDAIVAEAAEPPSSDEKGVIRTKVIEALKTVYDPEIPVDIYELGLIYDVDVADDRSVEIRMTLTSPNCPAAQSLPAEVEVKSAAVDGVRHAMVDIVWDPPWGPDRMSEAAKLELNIDY
jgi:FeS assembly SUF system protein